MINPLDEMRENRIYEQTLREKARTITDPKYRENPYADPGMMEAVSELMEWENASLEEKRKIKDRLKAMALEKRVKKIEEVQKLTICYRSNKKEIILWFENNEANKISFKGNRFKYLAKIFAHRDTKGKMSFHDLARVGTSKNVSNISGSIGAINKGFSKLSQTEKLIENLNGYYLNSKFIFKLVK